MGVDYYECDNCSLGFRDDSDYCAWCECGAKFHSVDCGKLHNYQVLDDVDEDDPRYDDYANGEHRIDMDQPITCVMCRKEKYTSYILLQALLKHFNLTENEAVKIWKGQK